MPTTYSPQIAVWELTMNCNMRCKHCGSSCEGPVPGELSTDEALALADALGGMRLKNITLSGGEPFTRSDWPLIASRLVKHGISVSFITNGWLLDEATVRTAADVGVRGIGISIDGLRETHDYIRKPGSFDRILAAVDQIQGARIPVTAVTCLHRRNLADLEGMRQLFVEKGLFGWQIQAADPMGNLLDRLDWMLEPREIEAVFDFAHRVMLETPIRMYLADNLGYYHLKEIEIRQCGHAHLFGEDAVSASVLDPGALYGIWRGCGAGKFVLGIRCNGDIIGCLSIRDDAYIEGNIRETPLEQLWHRPGAFAWNRDLDKSKLTGRCGTCQFGSRCLAGCAGMKITRDKTVTENGFCAYHAALGRAEIEAASVPEADLLTVALKKIEEEDLASAGMLLHRLCGQNPEHVEALNLLGFVHFGMENYPESLACNQQVLELDPGDPYAHKGQGLCWSRMGRVEEGIASLRQAIALSKGTFLDAYLDLAIVLRGAGRVEEALGLLEAGRARSQDFVLRSEQLYQQLAGVPV